MLLVVIGYGLVLVGHWKPDFAASMLRYYWFRMSDVFMPLGRDAGGVGLAAADRPPTRSRRIAEIGGASGQRAAHKVSGPWPVAIECRSLVDGGLILVAVGDLALQFGAFAGGIGLLRTAAGHAAGRQGSGLR